MAIRSFEQYSPEIAAGVFVDEMGLVIGNVILKADVSIWPMAVARGDIHRIEIGERSNIQDGAVLHVIHDHENFPGGAPVIIGKEVTVGHNATLHGCKIGDHCLIGMNATVLDKAELEPEIIVAANSLVPPNKVLKSGFLYMGNPVKPMRELTPAERKLIRYNALYYVELKNRHMA